MELTYIGIALGLGIIILGASYGISHVGGKALEAMGRQPEVAGQARNTSLLICAFIEGATLFALVICLILANK